jgi:hypothetical protein
MGKGGREKRKEKGTEGKGKRGSGEVKEEGEGELEGIPYSR